MNIPIWIQHGESNANTGLLVTFGDQQVQVMPGQVITVNIDSEHLDTAINIHLAGNFPNARQQQELIGEQEDAFIDPLDPIA